MSTPPSQLHSGWSSSVCLLSCARSIPSGFHLLAPSKALHTGGVIAQLTAGEGVGEAGERSPSMKRMQGRGRLEWLFGYRALKKAVFLLNSSHSCKKKKKKRAFIIF